MDCSSVEQGIGLLGRSDGVEFEEDLDNRKDVATSARKIPKKMLICSIAELFVSTIEVRADCVTYAVRHTN